MNSNTRALARLGAVLLFIAALAVAGAITAFPAHRGHHARSAFSHTYPPNPMHVERPKVTGPMPVVAVGNMVTTKRPIHSFAQLAAYVTPGTIVRAGPSRWLLKRPVAIIHRAVVEIVGGGLDLAPGAFLEARARGTLILGHMSVRGVGAEGRPLMTPRSGRGFLVARDGGVLRLEHDSIRDLGYLGVVAYGITFRRAGAGSRILGSTIQGNYFGVFISHADGVRVLGNRIVGSVVYGIDPYGNSTHILIRGNFVGRSGLHGIVLAKGIRFSRVERNVVDGARDHGLVLVAGSDNNTIRGNRIRNTFDGIVVTGSSRNVFAGNTMERVQRFGIRISHSAAGNHLDGNLIRRTRLGLYLYAGAHGNVLRDNRFSANYENVRIRSDAVGNKVLPRPSRSELGQ